MFKGVNLERFNPMMVRFIHMETRVQLGSLIMPNPNQPTVPTQILGRVGIGWA